MQNKENNQNLVLLLMCIREWCCETDTMLVQRSSAVRIRQQLNKTDDL